MITYKCYLLSKRHGNVYGLISENKDAVAVHTLKPENGKLKSIDIEFKKPSYVHKSCLHHWDIEITANPQEAINFHNQMAEYRRAMTDSP